MDTAKPKTMSLLPDEWRSLVASNLVAAHNVASAPVNPEVALTNAGWLLDHLDRLKFQTSAWQASVKQTMLPVPQSGVYNNTATDEYSSRPSDMLAQQYQDAVASNGAAKPKKKGGWPLGKKRARKAQAGATQ